MNEEDSKATAVMTEDELAAKIEELVEKIKQKEAEVKEAEKSMVDFPKNLFRAAAAVRTEESDAMTVSDYSIETTEDTDESKIFALSAHDEATQTSLTKDHKHGLMYDSLHGFDEIRSDDDTDSLDSECVTHNPAFVSSITSWSDPMEVRDSSMTTSDSSNNGSTRARNGGPRHSLSPKHGSPRHTAQRPDSLSLAVSSKSSEKKDGDLAAEFLPSEGVVEKDGEMVSFIAKDLEEKIKMSSPLSKEVRSLSRVSSTGSMRSHGSHRSSEVKLNLGIDPQAIFDLEIQAHRVGDSLHFMMENLSAKLHSMSALTVGCLHIYRDTVCKTCDSVDSTIKAMYTLMARCEELGQAMEPVYQIRDQLKDIKRVLDLFEAKVAEDPLLK